MTSSRGTMRHWMRRSWALVVFVGVGLGAIGLMAQENASRHNGRSLWQAAVRPWATTPTPSPLPFVAPVAALPSSEAWRTPSSMRAGAGPRRVAPAGSALAQPLPTHAALTEWLGVTEYARRYRLGLGLSRMIYAIALEQRIDPDLAFRMVRLESNFVPDVVSYAGAVGLTQLMPGTARFFQPGITAEALLDPETNLRIGFRYLRVLVKEFRGDLKLALLTYNRGPVAVYAALDAGEDPANGYDRVVLRGYAGRGVID